MLVSSDKGDPLYLSDAVAGNMQRKDKVYLAMGRGFQVNLFPVFLPQMQGFFPFVFAQGQNDQTRTAEADPLRG